ncbi:MAG: VanW family protein [candidate division WWE3 bacterium GW2011_GWC1_41_7]|jgi:vancomycin resistance protein YoaR|uniref:VanW family protein n=1 Tax=candidate division WWE3 bacterium GW2011_GWC1_41_7 TaxID=1619119 RepID=A0A0G0X773_UNCKA|nr:MAG: VanW family protein [candidate division WWE3 bacterium GW2011_GWC1_41_7]
MRRRPAKEHENDNNHHEHEHVKEGTRTKTSSFYINTGLIKPAFLITVATLLLVSLYHVYFARRIVPGVMVGNTRIGGMSYDQALNVLENEEKSTDRVLELKYNGYTYTIKPENINLEYNWGASVSRAFEVGRSGNFLTDNKDKLAGLLKTLYIPAFYELDNNSLSNILLTVKGEVNKEAKNAQFVLNEKELEIVASVEGLELDDQTLYDLIVDSYNDLDFSAKQLKPEVRKPDVHKEDLEPVKEQAEKVVFNPLVIKHEQKTWKLTPEQIIDLISVEGENGNPELRLNKARFEAYLESLGQEVSELPRGRVTGMDGKRVTGFEITKSGKELDTKKFTQDFREALFEIKPDVVIAMLEISGNSDPEKYGILALLGEGVSKFTGSARGRIKNLSLAAERTNGILVPPGGIYSFNKSVGEISGKTGYDTAYIISGGRTVLGEGGGVCQTSTTLFRAVLNSGLPIVTRYAHAYRVSYYEIGSPPGIDATIFQPSVDFQFKNDTPNYILVQALPVPEESTLLFRIYGTPDGREVSITEPVVSNVSPPPAPLYQDDPNLPKGTTKQVDFPAWGANVYFTREVKRDGETLFKDAYSSKFQPWRAVYLVGTKED